MRGRRDLRHIVVAKLLLSAAGNPMIRNERAEKWRRSLRSAKRPVFTDKEALLYHSRGRPGKIAVVPTKPMATQRDLSLAYSPGVAAPVLAIAENPSLAYDYTIKGNLVAVITNGTAILGLGNLGALAAKPVMEGKATLFKRFADIDFIDLEIDAQDVEAIHRRGALSRPLLRRHQSRGHQGAGVLHHRGAPARIDGHSRLPRRSARHRDHLHRGPAQRAASHRPRHQGHASSSAMAPARRASPVSISPRRWASRRRMSRSATPRASSIAAASKA